MALEPDDDARRRRVLDAFVDGAPRTLREVALAADLPEPAVETALESLVEAEDLRTKQVRGVDIRHRKAAEDAEVDLEQPIELYHRPAEALLDGVGTEDGDLGADAEDDRLDRRLARMDVGGASDMMRDWRRDAVRAAHEYLAEEGPCEPEDLLDDVYPAHQAGFDDPGAWWDSVRPRLIGLPGVTVEPPEWDVAE